MIRLSRVVAVVLAVSVVGWYVPSPPRVEAIASRGCRDYRGQPYVGAVVLNPDGTPIGCSVTDAAGAPSDLRPTVGVTPWATWFAGQAIGSLYTPRLGWYCDDCFVAANGVNGNTGLPIGFTINFFGQTYTDVFVNSNGSIRFDAGSSNYNDSLAYLLFGKPSVIAYGLDLDNREISNGSSAWGSGRHGDFFYWGRTTFEGHTAFVATWMNIQSYASNITKTNWNTFQIMLVDVDDNAGTDVDVIVNYGGLQANDQGYECDGSHVCRVSLGLGYADPGGNNSIYAPILDDDGRIFDGLLQPSIADDGANPLRASHLNSTVPGRYRFQMRNGTLPQVATTPGAVTITSVTAGDGQIDLGWTLATPLGNMNPNGYAVRWRAAGTSTWTDTTSAGRTRTITGLTNSTTYEFQVAAGNSMGTGPFSATVTARPEPAGHPQWTDTTLGPIQQDVAYADAVGAAGTPSPTYAITAGAMPAGLSLNTTTGAITGTPATSGTYSFTITASNGVGTPEPFEFTGTIAAPPPPPTTTAPPTTTPPPTTAAPTTAAPTTTAPTPAPTAPAEPPVTQPAPPPATVEITSLSTRRRTVMVGGTSPVVNDCTGRRCTRATAQLQTLRDGQWVTVSRTRVSRTGRFLLGVTQPRWAERLYRVVVVTELSEEFPVTTS